jgi:hypothetical protein
VGVESKRWWFRVCGRWFSFGFSENRGEREKAQHIILRERKSLTHYCVPRSRICEKTRQQNLVFFLKGLLIHVLREREGCGSRAIEEVGVEI